MPRWSSPSKSRARALATALAAMLLATGAHASDLESDGLITHMSQWDYRWEDFAVGATTKCEDGWIYPWDVVAGVDLIRCNDDPKGPNPGYQDDHDGVVGTWGCLLTSIAMIAERHNLLPGLGSFIPMPRWDFQRISPVHVHLALAKNGGYDGSQDILMKHASYPLRTAFMDPGMITVGLRTRLRAWPGSQPEVDGDLRRGFPSVLVIQPDLAVRATHAVVVVGFQGKEYLVLDPWEHSNANSPGRHAKPLSALYGEKWERKIKAAIQVTPAGQDGMSWLDFEMHSPVEMLVVSPDGRRTGFDPTRRVIVEEIPRSSYMAEVVEIRPMKGDPTKSLLIDDPAAGRWSLTLVATGDGPFTLGVSGQASGMGFRQELTGTVRAGDVRKFTVRLDPAAPDPIVFAEGATIPPLADAGAARAAFAGTPVAFDGSRSRDPDGTVASFAWDFGDGTSGTGATPTHAYAAPGVYTATLAVTDDAGATASDQLQVGVYAATAGSPGNTTVVDYRPASSSDLASPADYASMSGDGRVVAFQTWGPYGDPFVLVRDLDAATTTQIAQAAFPTLSRSGRYVAYERGGGVYVHDRQSGTEVRGDVAADGTPSNARSWASVLSGDGRHLLFVSEGTNLAAAADGLGLLLKDLDAGTVHFVGYPDAPYGGGDMLRDFGVSDDGGVVAYKSRLPNFGGFKPDVWIRATGEHRFGPTVLTYKGLTLSGDGNTVAISGDYTYAGDSDVFVMDVQTLAVESACVSSLEVRADRAGLCTVGALSRDGRFVVFTSTAGNLVAGDVEGTDVLIRDRSLGTTELATYSSSGVQLPDWGFGKRPIGGVCDDGRCVSFVTKAPGVPEDANGNTDVYVRRLASAAEPAPPLADGSGPYHGWAGHAVSFDASRSSSAGGLPLTATWSFGDGSAPVAVPADQAVEHVYAAPGTFTASVTVSDGARASGPSQARVEVLETPPEATTVLSVYPSCGSPGTVVTLSLVRQALDAGASWNEATQGTPGSVLEAAPPSTLELSVSGGSGGVGPISLPVTRLARTAALEYTASADWSTPADLPAGAHTLAVGGGSSIFEVPCAIPAAVANQPVAVPGGPYVGIVGAPVVFDGTGSTDPRGRTLTHTWEFGDGTTATGARVEHAYADPGTYRAVLSVDNGEQVSNCGIAGHCAVVVRVALAEAPPPPPPVEPAPAAVGGGGCGCGTAGIDAGAYAVLLAALTLSRVGRGPRKREAR